MIDYRERRVAPPLDRFVECIWFLSTPPRTTIDCPEQTILPDGCIEAIFHLGERFLDRPASDRTRAQPAALVAGVLTRPLRVAAVAGADTVGVRFRPGAAYPFFSGPVTELTDRVTPLADLWSDADMLAERLSGALTDRDRAAMLTDALVHRLAHAPLDRTVAGAVGDVVQSAGRASVAAIAGRAGVTPRHLQRRFSSLVGVPPKTLARILRFQNTLRHRGASPAAPDWLRVAVDCGYTDQSHLIRDYAQLAGATPASLLAAEGELSAYFTAPQRLAALFDARR